MRTALIALAPPTDRYRSHLGLTSWYCRRRLPVQWPSTGARGPPEEKKGEREGVQEDRHPDTRS